MMVGAATVMKLRGREQTLVLGEQIVLGQPPGWAMSLMAEVATANGRADLPSLKWTWMRKHAVRSSMGTTTTLPRLTRAVISVRAGTDPVDQRHVVLHELAHWLVGTEDPHTRVYYAQAFKLFAAYGDLHHAFSRELRYRPEQSRLGLQQAGLDAEVVDALLDQAERDRASSPMRTDISIFFTASREVTAVSSKEQLPDAQRERIEEGIRRDYPATTKPVVFRVTQSLRPPT
jgi:hypothetical protein